MFRSLASIRLTSVAFLLAVVSPSFAQGIDTVARQAIVVDYNTGTVLMEKNADELMTPSSMSKLMTVYQVLSRLKEGSLKGSDILPVSESAWRKHYRSGGSLMFLPVNSQASVDDLLRGIIIQSGNDACSVIAEGLSGSEEAFAEEATRRARQIGLTHSTFKNASGWPEEGHQMTARDLSLLAAHLIRDFPEYYPIFAEKEFAFHGIRQGNRNPLLWQNIAGADGLKTGHSEAGGFGLTGSAIRDGRRVIVVLNGLPDGKSRADESRRLIEWAFRDFNNYLLFNPGDVVAEAETWLGNPAKIPLTVETPVEVTLNRTARPNMRVVASYDGPLKAPIKKGARVGMLTVEAPGMAPLQRPLIAGADAEKLGFIRRIGAMISQILWGPPS
ncbi:MAG: D-alanyl-D-alanine carboxypeptidase family protein [Rhodospirillaceae bacterium]|nr:D-alanyl-D-alanine carboxypeptidase family protein [Rhodospirillaceae bacterium]